MVVDLVSNDYWAADTTADPHPVVRLEFDRPVDVDSVVITSGAAADYARVGRPRTLALADSSGGARQLALPDDPAPAASSLRARHVRWLSVRVADVYPGVPPSGTVALAEIELFRLG